MATGKVLQFDQARGYGFVAAEDGGADVFLHASVFDGDADLLAPGARVEFKIMAGDRGRKAFAARLADGAADSWKEPVPAVATAAAVPAAAAARPNPSVIATRIAPVMPQAPGTMATTAQEDVTDEEQMCDVLSQAELGQELTELLMGNVPTLTGQQILEIRQGVLECARKHGWVDI